MVEDDTAAVRLCSARLLDSIGELRVQTGEQIRSIAVVTERGCVADQPQRVRIETITARNLPPRCGWSRTTQPRSGLQDRLPAFGNFDLLFR